MPQKKKPNPKSEPKAASKAQRNKQSQVDYCSGCGAKCCKYYTIPLDVPEDRTDFQSFRWYILHQGASIFIDNEDDWFVSIASPCRELTADDKCRIYHRRPPICRNHGFDVCERNDDGYDFKEHFHDEHQLMAYAEKFLRRRAAQARRRSEAAVKAWATRRQKNPGKETR